MASITFRPLGEGASTSETAGANNVWYNPQIDINLIRDPKRFIYIGTVSKRDFIIERPPLFPKLHVRACGAAERFREVTQVPDPTNQAIQDTDNGRLRGVAHDGLRVAIDLVNPNNISNNFDWICPPEAANEVATGHGCDLSKQGVFISLEWPPTEETLQKAEKRRHEYYNYLREEIDRQTEKDALSLVAMNKDFHMMADYFGLTYPWHKVMTAVAQCPNCGEQIKQGVPYHKLGDTMCIIDWRAAVRAGIKKKEDVPDEILAQWDAEAKGGQTSKPSGQKR